MARRGLTPPLGDGDRAPKSFADITGRKRPVSSAKLLVANKPRRAVAVTRGPKRSEGPAIAPLKSVSISHVYRRRYGGLTAIGRRGAAALDRRLDGAAK